MKTDPNATANPDAQPGCLQRSVRARPPDEPKSLMEWLWRVRRYEDGIYVREQKADGKWGNAKLSELPPERWAFHVARWLEEGSLPCRILEPDERPNDQAQTRRATDP